MSNTLKSLSTGTYEQIPRISDVVTVETDDSDSEEDSGLEEGVNTAGEKASDTSETIWHLTSQTHLGDPEIKERTSKRNYQIALTSAIKRERCYCQDIYTLINISGRIPIDEQRYDFVNKVLQSNIKISSAEIMDALTGVKAERLYRCINCQNCRTCLRESKNEAISIEKMD